MGRSRFHKDPLTERDVAFPVEGDPFQMAFDALAAVGLSVLAFPAFLCEVADRLEAIDAEVYQAKNRIISAQTRSVLSTRNSL